MKRKRTYTDNDYKKADQLRQRSIYRRELYIGNLIKILNCIHSSDTLNSFEKYMGVKQFYIGLVGYLEVEIRELYIVIVESYNLKMRTKLKNLTLDFDKFLEIIYSADYFVLGELMASQVVFQNLLSISDNFELLGLKFDYNDFDDEGFEKTIFSIIQEIIEQRHIAVHHPANRQRMIYQPHIALSYVQFFLDKLSSKIKDLADKTLELAINPKYANDLIPIELYREDYSSRFNSNNYILDYSFKKR